MAILTIVDTFVCLWCQREFQRIPPPAGVCTREHIIPACMGGSSNADNIRLACSRCNHCRGKVVEAFVRLRNLTLRLSSWRELHNRKRKFLKKLLRSFRRRLPGMVELWKKWTDLERKRLGWAPSERYYPVVPDTPGRM